MSGQVLLKMQGITKAFASVVALSNAQFQLKTGTVHALMGENGAGKSTLMKILIGIHEPDEGTIIFDNKQVKIQNSRQALDMGISMIHQEINPIMEMTVADNIFLGREPLAPISRFVNKAKLYKQTQELLSRLDITGISPSVKMKELSIAQCQMVEIAKAVSYDSRLIIMDEPTSAICDAEVEKLFKIICELKSKGIAIIYISHRMDEIFRIADEITVLRDGYYVDSQPSGELDHDKLVSLMVGRELKDMFCKEPSKPGVISFEVKGLTAKGKFRNVSFHLHKGEVLGIAGLMGAGRTEIVEAIFGMRPYDAGEILKAGKPLRIRSEQDAINNGIALVTEDRRKYGLVLEQSIKNNISLSSLKKFSVASLIHRGNEMAAAKDISEKIRVKTPNLNNKCNTLSGGNQQKVVLSKWLMTDPDILIFDEPTRGIDVGAKNEIYKIITSLAQSGKSIIMISSEMPEIMGMSDRILVVREGEISGEIAKEDVTQEKIMKLAAC